jgi:hypothetical protein
MTWADDSDFSEPILYNQRWVQLGILSLFALISDWVCFSNSAIPNTWETVTGVRSPPLPSNRYTDQPSSPNDLFDTFCFHSISPAPSSHHVAWVCAVTLLKHHESYNVESNNPKLVENRQPLGCPSFD